MFNRKRYFVTESSPIARATARRHTAICGTSGRTGGICDISGSLFHNIVGWKRPDHRRSQQQNGWNAEKAELEKQCAEIRTISEQRQLNLYVTEAKLMQAEGATNAAITDLRKRLATTQFDVSMTQDKVHAIIRRHRLNTLKLVDESLEKGGKHGQRKLQNFSYYAPTRKIGRLMDQASSRCRKKQ